MRFMIAALGCAVLLAGCGVSTDDRATEPAFNPCDDIPDDALAGLGLDPSTELRNLTQSRRPGWNVCRWNGPNHYLFVSATVDRRDQLRAWSGYVDIGTADIDGRTGMVTRSSVDSDGKTCEIALESDDGTAILRLGYDHREDAPEEPCTTVAGAARTLAPHIPA